MTDARQAIQRTSLGSGIEQLILDMPGKSANVLTKDFLRELAATIDELENSKGLSGVVITSAKPGIYIAGADIVAISQTLETSRQEKIEFCRHGQRLLDRLTELPFPVVAAIHGVCVGGGLEFALACDARVATTDRKTLLGLPEVKLGLIPGWGGTVRLPRLIGLPAAIDLVTTGRLVSGADARELGLVDATTEPDSLLKTAIDLAKELGPTYKTQRERTKIVLTRLSTTDASELRTDFMRAIEANRELHPQAPLVALDVMIDAAANDFATACQKEAEAMAGVYGSEPCAGLIQNFFLSERAKKSGRFAGVAVNKIERVGIAGAGVMGGDIAQVCPVSTPTVIYDLDSARAEAVAHGCNARANANDSAIVARGIADFENCDLVIESIVEDVAAKRTLLGGIESHLAPAAILATNTSVIPIAELSQSLVRPDRFCGLHFCYPAKVRRLVEVVRGPVTSAATLATACDWVRSIGKVPLPVADAPGFIINRLLCPMFNEAGHLLTQGCSLGEVEAAMCAFGFALGPFAFMDAIGLDTLHSAGAYLIPRLSTPTEPSLLLHAMNKLGWKGRKSGRGFYAYPSAGAAPQPNESLPALIQQYYKPTPVLPAADQIVRRLLMVMVNQAADVLAERVVGDADDVDLALILGGGFPDHRGGLLFWARRRGLPQLVSEMESWTADPGSTRRYRISQTLRQMAATS